MSIESLNAFSMDFFSLKGKTAIVTGGNSGLGQAFAMALAKAGANLFIPSFVKDNGETKELIEAQGVEVAFMQVDITEKGAPQKIIAACCERFGTVDILVNNAGICKLNKVLDFGRADWDPMIDVNLTAAFELSYEAAKIMIPQNSGKIINICSLFSYLGGQWSPAYSATKHALAGLPKHIAMNLGNIIFRLTVLRRVIMPLILRWQPAVTRKLISVYWIIFRPIVGVILRILWGRRYSSPVRHQIMLMVIFWLSMAVIWCVNFNIGGFWFLFYSALTIRKDLLCHYPVKRLLTS